MPGGDAAGAVDLFGQHRPRQLVRPGQAPQRQHRVGALQHRAVQPLGAADEEEDRPAALQPAFQPGREGLGVGGLADRQIGAMATHLEDKLEQAGLKRVKIEGASGSDWVLIDAGDIVIHLFKPEARTLYALERMWGAELDEETPAPG